MSVALHHASERQGVAQHPPSQYPRAWRFSASGVRYHEQDALGNVIGTHKGTSVTQTITYDALGVPSASGYPDSRLMWKGLVWKGDEVGLY